MKFRRKKPLFASEISAIDQRVFRRGLTRVLYLPLALTLLFAIILIFQINRVLRLNEWVSHTQQVLITIRETESNVSLREAALRGYFLIHDAPNRKQYLQLGLFVEQEFQDLHAEVVDNQPQMRRLDSLLTQYWAWEVQSNRSLAKTDSLKYDSSLMTRAALLTGIMHSFDDLAISEQRYLNEREQSFIDGTHSLTISVIILALVFGAIAGFNGRRQIWLFSAHFGRALDQATENRDLLQTTILSIGDAIIVTDAHMRVTIMNPIAESMTGWQMREARDRQIREVFPIVNETTREPIENPLEVAVREGRTVALANHTLLLSRKGIEYPVDDSAAPIRNSRREIVGAILVFRDISTRKETEQQLNKREREFRSLVEGAPDLIIRFDRDLTITFVNPMIEQVLGIPPSSLINKRFKDIGIPESVYTAWEKSVLDVFLLGRSISVETEYYTVRGLRKYQARFVPETSDNGTDSVLTFWRDITDLKRTEDRLRQSEEHFRGVVDNSLDGFVLLRSERSKDTEIVTTNNLQVKAPIVNFAVIYANERADALVGKPFSKSQNKQITEILTAEEASELTGKASNVVDSGTPLEEEFATTVDGNERWLRRQIVRVGDGVAITSSDLTASKELERSLAQREREFRALVERSPDIIGRISKDLRLVYMNPVIEKVYGVPWEQLSGKSLDELIQDPEDLKKQKEYYRQVFEEGKEIVYESDSPSPQGPKHYQTKLVPEYEDGKVVSVLAIVSDITAFHTALTELYRREEEFRALVEHSPDIIQRYDKDFRLLYISPIIETLIGRTAESLIGKTWQEAGIPEVTFQSWKEQFNLAIEEKSTKQLTLTFDTLLGERSFELIIIPEFDRDRNVQFLLVTARDTTERVRILRRLRQNEERLRTIVETSLDAFYLVEAVRKDGTIVDFTFDYINKHGADILTKPVRDVLRKTVSEAFPSHLSDDYIQKLIRVVETRKPMIEEYFTTTKYVQGAKWLRSQYVPVGDTVAITTTDISQQKEIEVELRASEERFRKLVNHAREGIFSTDVKGYFTFANPSILELSGYRMIDILELRFTDLVPENDRNRIQRHFYRQFLTRTEVSYLEAPFIAKSGKVQWLAVTTNLRFKESAIEGFDCIAIEIERPTA